ncbi:MAG TPA: tetratricopeptide repeat protein [Pyrinomonadaceae bacterium]
MYRSRNLTLLSLALLLTALASFGCENVDNNAHSTPANADSGKIPVTTASAEARKEFLAGRDLSDRLLIQDSIQHFDKALSLDPNFALAELTRAQSSPTAKEFFDHLKKAVSLADKASNGERLLILATEAGANANPSKQKELLEQLVAAYPNDERAHFNLGGYYFGQQDYAQAISHYKKATELAPTYSGAYNILGYAYRQSGDYASAEQAFKKYTELIPNDPNPYDSYGELLLKMGRFDDSITQYRKALSIDPNFVASHLGISADLMYQGKYDDAAKELQIITDKARSDGDRRTALFGLTVMNVDAGKMDEALKTMDQQYALAEKIGDVAQMSGDLTTKANILIEMGKFDDARTLFERSLKLTQDSNLSQEIKDNANLFHHFNLAKVAIGKKDLATAKKEAEEFSRGAEASKNSGQVKQSHELMGTIALEEKDFDKAVAEFQQANQQNPYDLYRLCQAYQGKNDAEKAKDSCSKAAGFNSLPLLNYAFIRTKAQKMSSGSKAD